MFSILKSFEHDNALERSLCLPAPVWRVIAEPGVGDASCAREWIYTALKK